MGLKEKVDKELLSLKAVVMRTGSDDSFIERLRKSAHEQGLRDESMPKILQKN